MMHLRLLHDCVVQGSLEAPMPRIDVRYAGILSSPITWRAM